jgi:hypothetical protein
MEVWVHQCPFRAYSRARGAEQFRPVCVWYNPGCYRDERLNSLGESAGAASSFPNPDDHDRNRGVRRDDELAPIGPSALFRSRDCCRSSRFAGPGDRRHTPAFCVV